MGSSDMLLHFSLSEDRVDDKMRGPVFASADYKSCMYT